MLPLLRKALQLCVSRAARETLTRVQCAEATSPDLLVFLGVRGEQSRAACVRSVTRGTLRALARPCERSRNPTQRFRPPADSPPQPTHVSGAMSLLFQVRPPPRGRLQSSGMRRRLQMACSSGAPEHAVLPPPAGCDCFRPSPTLLEYRPDPGGLRLFWRSCRPSCSWAPPTQQQPQRARVRPIGCPRSL
jgi:hypothetical protein